MLTLSEEADRIEKKIIADFEDDATGVLDALIGFLQEIKKGEYEDFAGLYLYPLIDKAINRPFKDRYELANVVIRCAIRWQAEQIAAEEEKLTRPTP
jgi:hypothetical protein